jgi:dolichol-phosphate mannosyltransferase
MLHPHSQDVRQFLRFAVIGVLQNGLNLGAFALAIAHGIPLLIASVMAAAVALSVSFSLNRRWTFPGATDRSANRAVRFVTIWLAFVLLALPILALLVDVVHVPRVLSQAIIIVIGAPASYVVQRRWTFGQNGNQSRINDVAGSTEQAGKPLEG